MALLLGFGVVGGLLCTAGAGLGLRVYEREREAEEQRRKEVQDLHQQVRDANTRYDRAQETQRRRLAKFQVANGRIADAIATGGSLRYELEHARHTALRANTLLDFDRSFDSQTYAASVETWRASTGRMLDEELPGLRLGGWFSEMEGTRGIGPSGYQLTKVLQCINALQLVQRDLRSHVEQLVPE